MTIEPPQPPTAPAPAVRPTPPTPPRIDKTPFVKEQASDDAPQVNRKVETPEDMARDAVAHGAGALTKRTVERNDNDTPPPNQTVTVIPPDAPLVADDTQSDYDRGQDVLREFRELDARDAQAAYNPPAQTSTDSPRPVAPKLNHDDGHGAPFWIFTAVFVIVAAFVVAKKFLFTDKPALTKAQLFDDAPPKSKATTDEVKPSPPPPKPAKLPPKKDDSGKHFEVRV